MLLDESCHPIYHEGTWQLHECGPAWDLNASHRSLIAYTWRQGDERRLIVINYSESSAQARITLPDFDLAGELWRLHDALHQVDYDRDGSEMSDHACTRSRPWDSHIFLASRA
jgi:hypothetical protein